MTAANLGDAVVATARRYIKPLTNNVLEDNGLLQFLRDENKIEVYNGGGRTVVETLLYNTSGNSSAQWFEGFDTFTPPTSYEIIDGAEYQWKQLGALVTISSREAKINRGSEQQVSFIKSRIEHAQSILTNMLSSSLYSAGTGNGGKEIGGLQLLVADDPTAAGTVGGISQVAQPWWRNYYAASSTVTSSNIIAKMNAAWLAMKRGKDVPTIWVGDDDMYGYYETALQALQRITTSKMADSGYQALMYKGKPVIFDDQCTNKRLYALNTHHLHLRKMDEEMFDVGDKVSVANALYTVVPISMMGCLTTCRRASHGVIIDD